MREIERWLAGWGPDTEDYYLYELWDKHHVLPYAGGWLDQPESIHRLFTNCALWDEWLLLKSELPTAIKDKGFEDS